MDNRSDDCVLSKSETARLINVSVDTLDRMTKRDEIRRVRISDRRVGYRLGTIREWQRKNEETAA